MSGGSMQTYGSHLSPAGRDATSAGSSTNTFQPSAALGQTMPGLYGRDLGYRISSPPVLHHPPQGQHSQTLTFAVNNSSTDAASSPSLKRKHPSNLVEGVKRRRDTVTDDDDGFDGGQGAKHWTDEEKTRLFQWLMGPDEDEHWNSLRAAKNSCLRTCASDLFENKKTYQALKGCLDRNFLVYKQIYAFEGWNQQSGGPPVNQSSTETERLREYDRRLQLARQAGADVGNMNARTIDYWHRSKWYSLFDNRWHGDPAVTRPIVHRSSNQNAQANEVEDGDDDDPDFNTDPSIAAPSPASPILQSTLPPLPPQPPTHPPGPSNSHLPPHHQPVTFVHSHTMPSPMPASPVFHPRHSPITPSQIAPDGPSVSIAVPQAMLHSLTQYMQVQTQTMKLKAEYLRRREEREEREGQARRERERRQEEREMQLQESNKRAAELKQKADRAVELLGNPKIDGSLKQAAADYLKKLFASD